MEERRLGKSDIQIPVMTFGAWAIGGWMWGGTDEKAAEEAILTAIDSGMSCIDTAAVYGFGLSETLVGRAIRGRRSEVLIATKCGLAWEGEEGEEFFETPGPEDKPVMIRKNLRPKSIVRECEASLRRLGIETIDLYQCHFPDPTTHAEETMAALVRLQEQGKIRAIGVSNFSVEQMAAFSACAPVHSDQPHYSLLDRAVEAEILPWCRDNDVAVLTHSTLERGMLTGKIRRATSFPESDHRSKQVWFQPGNRERAIEAVKKLEPYARGHDATQAQIATAWILAQPGVTTAIVGARNAEQVRENVRAANIVLSQSEVEEIRRLFESVGEPLRD